MAGSSNIEWTDATWNPIAGCSVVSPGCTNCYAMKMAARVEAMAAAQGRSSPYDGLTIKTKAGAVWNGTMRLVESALTQPLSWRKPRKIFVNSMSDLFHPDVPDTWIDQVVAVMHLTPQHTYQILTKRSDRMRMYFERLHRDLEERLWATGMYEFMNAPSLPLPNVWLGVSAEDQERWDARVPELLWTRAAKRFVSVEPMLGPIDPTKIDVLGGDAEVSPLEWDTDCVDMPDIPPLDWVIVGGESGKAARPMHPDWAREIRDECDTAGVAFFFKQWGEWAPGEASSNRETLPVHGAHWFDDRWDFVRITAAEGAEMHADDEPDVWKVGKQHSGRLLDGVEHNAMPEVTRG